MTQPDFVSVLGSGGLFPIASEAFCQTLVLKLEERIGIDRVDEPVTVGIPLQPGLAFDPGELVLCDSHDRPTRLQVQVLARWRDGSIKWALIDFQANVAANGRADYQLRGAKKSERYPSYTGITVQQSFRGVVVDTGRGVFFLDSRICKPFGRVIVQGKSILETAGSDITLVDSEGNQYCPRIQITTLETAGPLRATLCVYGSFDQNSHVRFADFTARLSFYAQSGVVKIEFTIRNSRAARHPGGLWDLGDEGSIYFRDLSLYSPLASNGRIPVQWTIQPATVMSQTTCSNVEIYQDSSGGQNWNSTNHVNRFGKIPTSFRGYRVVMDGKFVSKGERATPTLSIGSDERNVAATVVGFWQNFPKAIEVDRNRLIVRLFPRQYSDVYELQGGEQKTHTLFLAFGNTRGQNLGWIHDQLVCRATSDWYAKTGVFPYLVPERSADAEEPLLRQAYDLINGAIEGDNTFFDRREVIDEYGWRHYGDIYADHEAVCHQARPPLIAHYNNQYDVIYGTIVQHIRSGDRRWYELARDLARHVIDIDLYHTVKDRPAFNGGLFWHTEHYKDAATSTHRGYSKSNADFRTTALHGGGPACEHNYATGLLYYYFLTGDPTAKEAVCSLANWVISMDEAPDGFLSCFDRRLTGLCSATADRGYHGPGRGAGNSISVLLDAFGLTQSTNYQQKAEQLIRRCIHPRDDIEKRKLVDIEHRWSYTVFLQVLGKYLDFKVEQDEIDYMYSYATESLLHYAKWMREKEVPYKSVLDRVKIPTETWPAQDIRKSNVFKFAAKYSDEPLRSAFLQKSEEFFNAAVTDLMSFETCRLTRPIVLMLTNAYMHSYFRYSSSESVPRQTNEPAFGNPAVFTPRYAELQKVRETFRNVLRVLKATRQSQKKGMASTNTEGNNCHA